MNYKKEEEELQKKMRQNWPLWAIVVPKLAVMGHFGAKTSCYGHMNAHNMLGYAETIASVPIYFVWHELEHVLGGFRT